MVQFFVMHVECLPNMQAKKAARWSFYTNLACFYTNPCFAYTTHAERARKAKYLCPDFNFY
jgi:hypothetical protein